MTRSRRQRAKEEGTLPESVKGLLQGLVSEVARIKLAVHEIKATNGQLAMWNDARSWV